VQHLGPPGQVLKALQQQGQTTVNEKAA
jgi:hypothetical protein